ncbi:MAG: dTMP kinase [Candidatus Bilamarchaeaceae archaeon]
MIVVFEGIDGSGKDTQIELLRKYLSFEYFKYPTKNYQILRDYLDKKISLEKKASFLLFLSDIANEQKKLENAKKSSKLVVVDRYVYSTIAYELDELGYEKSKKIVNEIDYVQPDLVILFDIDEKEAQKRKYKQKQPDRYESDSDYLKKVREKFIKLANEKFHAKKWVVLDASLSPEEINEKIRNEIAKLL